MKYYCGDLSSLKADPGKMSAGFVKMKCSPIFGGGGPIVFGGCTNERRYLHFPGMLMRTRRQLAADTIRDIHRKLLSHNAEASKEEEEEGTISRILPLGFTVING